MNEIKIKIQKNDFDLSTELALVAKNANNIGATVSFVGFVRDLPNQPLTKMILEHYPKMTEKALTLIANKAQQRWDLGNITLIHRVGELQVNDQIVLVIASSAHRKNAFDACEFMMDYLKKDAPFWKKEHTQNTSEWVKPHQNPLGNLN